MQPGTNFASYLASMQQALAPGGNAQAQQAAEKQRRGNALLAAGLGMMAAGGRPGAGALDSLGVGGMAGLNELNSQRAAAADAAHKTRAEQLAAFNAAASLYGSDATRAQTAAYRADASRRADESLDERRKHNRILEARAMTPKPRDPQAARNDNTRTILAVDKAARENATDPLTGELDQARYQQELISKLDMAGMLNHPQTQKDFDALPSGALYKDPNTGIPSKKP